MCFWPIEISSERCAAKDGFDACSQRPRQSNEIAQSRVTTCPFEIRNPQLVQTGRDGEFLNRERPFVPQFPKDCRDGFGFCAGIGHAATFGRPHGVFKGDAMFRA